MALRKISSTILPRPSRVLTEINSNALMVAWTNENKTDRIFSNRFELYEYLNSEVIGDTAIDYLEFGVFQGETVFKWAALNENDSSRFFGFDSFEGLPDGWDGVLETKKKAHFGVDGLIPKTEDSRIKFVKGLFQETLSDFKASFKPSERLVIHNDSDLFSSTLYTLTMLDEIITEGTILIFDEFYSSSHEFQAFYDYTKAYQRKFSVLGAVSKDPYHQIALIAD